MNKHNKNINIEILRRAIKDRGMLRKWADGGLHKLSEEEKETRAKKKQEDAEKNFINMMSSSKNNGTADYRLWAINQALGKKITRRGRFKTKAYT